MKFKKGEIPYIHIFIYSKLREKTKSPYITKKFLKEWIRRTIKIPNYLIIPIAVQMEENKLIRKIHHDRYEILESKSLRLLEDLKVFSLI